MKTFMGLSKNESDSMLCSYLNIRSFKAILQNLIYKFIQRSYGSNNTIIKAILASSVPYSSNIRKHWFEQLYVYFWLMKCLQEPSLVLLIMYQWCSILYCHNVYGTEESEPAIKKK